MSELKSIAAVLLTATTLVYYFKFIGKIKFSSLYIVVGILLARVLLSIIVHEVLHYKYPSDVPIFFGHALRISNGEVPSVDFSFPYGLLFGYLMSAVISIYKSPISIILLFHIAEFLGLILIYITYNKKLQTNTLNDIFIFYFLNPISFICLGLTGQDESFLVLIVGAFMYFSYNPSNKTVFWGLVFIMLTKVLSIMCFAGYFIKDKISRGILLFLITILTFGVLYYFGFRVIDFQVSIDGNTNDMLLSKITSGNLWFLFKLFGFNIINTKIPMLFTLISLTSLYIYFFFFSKKTNLPNTYISITILSFLLFGIFYKMTFSQYYTIIIPLLIIVISSLSFNRKIVIPFIVWSALVSVDSTLYYNLNYYIGFEGIRLLLVILYQLLIVSLSMFLVYRIFQFSQNQTKNFANNLI